MVCSDNLNPNFPDEIILTFNGSTITTQIYDYTESGGEKNIMFKKTMGRGHKVIKGAPTDWLVSLSGTDLDSYNVNLFENNLDYPIPVTFTWTGSRTISYTNARITKFNYSLTADDRLIYSMDVMAPFYKLDGTPNRVVS